jgi:polysaccharide export outer membrane protein
MISILRFGALAALAISASLFSQTAGAQSVPAPGAGAATAAPLAAPLDIPPQDENYRLGPGDKLHIIVFGELDLTGDYGVSDQGNVSVPLVGSIHAGGETLGAFTEQVTEGFAKGGYLTNPHVAVEVLTYRPFYILGEVNKPGQYPYVPPITVMDAAAIAGGFTYRANQHRIMVRHADETEEHAVSLHGSDVPVKPGDTIRVLERYF